MTQFRGYRITSHFGWRTHPIRGIREWHTGIDLVKKHRAPIEAFTDGEVIYAGEGKKGTGLGGYGIVVLIKDQKNRGQLYAHLDSTAVIIGQTIQAGTVVGFQGATGQVTGSHLHYEVRKKAENTTLYGWSADRNNNCLNPVEYLASFLAAVLRHGDQGQAVQDLQKKLVSLGYRLPRFGADGKFGNETEAAVKAFQQDQRIAVDGIVGPVTREKLKVLLKR
ncbi:peptidoglycan DD-metalloendopeptidase family protein [Aquibacillus albus]|uniref:Murein DD-endopeptidase MepM/ murein hydrolase activator NlpD n=1 Tax=Aquibacillus albus TaxID=1168171 RepID=A0ABS2N605_9BACI|nr:peptidoglycan DD-metalloendopeptidase family protein [Aquibacillus albus]MBM7573566.1 murein DD-endopeptidase MepM/ murein hydrolase activator NlpD [Aquibacillus albus]